MASNDHLMMTLGLDAKPFERAITSVKAQVNDLATEKWSDFKKAFSVAAIAAGIKTMSEQMVELRRNAEDVGSSIGFLYTLQSLSKKFGGQAEDANAAMMKLAEAMGSARTEGGAAEEKFTRFGISLYDLNGNANDTEEVFKQISDAYRNSTDAATKAALAFEFFGKTGRNINNVLGEGRQGLEEYRKTLLGIDVGLEAGDINAIADAYQNLKGVLSGVGDALKAFTGRTIDGLGAIGRLAGALSSGMSPLAAWNQEMDFWQNRNKTGEDSVGSKQSDEPLRNAKNAAQLAKQERDDKAKIAEIEEKIAKSKRDSASVGDAQKLASLKEQLALEENLNLIGSAKEMAEQRLKIEEARVKVLEQERKMKKDEEDRARRLVELDAEREEKIIDFLQRRAAFEKSETERQRDIREAKESRFKFSLEELANANAGAFRGQTRSDILAAQDVRRLEQRAQWQNLFGTREERDRLQAMADQRRQQIGLLRADERYPFRAIEKANASAAESLKFLEAEAKSLGIKMQPVMGK